MVRRCIGSWTLLAVVSVAGCSSSKNVYEVELRPKGDAVERDLTAWREGTPSSSGKQQGGKPERDVEALSSKELERIAAAYGEATPPQRAKKYEFSGRFRGSLPNDIGGAGSFTQWKSSLGDLCVYVERVRGNDDLAADLDARRAALNRVIDIFIGWLDGELQKDPIAPKLHALLDGPVRRDVGNILLDAWSMTAANRNQSPEGRDAAVQDFLARSFQYLLERGYFAADDLPRIVRVLQEWNGLAKHKRLLDIVRAMAMRKLDLEDDAPLDGLMALLGDPKRFERTLLAYVETTPEFAAKVQQSRIMAALGMPSREVEPGEVLFDLVFRSILRWELFPSPDRLRTRLHVAAAPVAANGQYDADAGTVNWDRAIDRADAVVVGMPLTMFAVWAEPNEAEQTRRFGKVILSGEPLARYVFWHRGLTDMEQGQWSQLLDALRPGAGLQQPVEAFRFADEKSKDGKEAGDLAHTARDLLLDAMQQHGLE
ncbi:MAG: hypothetical protein WD875_03635 [Pirellulales bacterium]